MTTDPFAWVQSLDTLFDQIWVRLSRGVHDRHAPARHPTLATVTAQGHPRARTVVLRAADKAEGTLRMYTDLHSAKVAELRGTPFAALHVWDNAAHLQIRISGVVSVLTGADVAALWDKVPDQSRKAYGGKPCPGTPISDALEYSKIPDASAFAVLQFTINTLDALHLGPDHRRAEFRRENEWSGQWITP